MIANNLALLFNGLTLALALGLLILVLWQDPNSTANRYFALFLFSALIWASGSLLSRAAAYVNAGPGTIQAGLRLLDMGFSASTLTLYTTARCPAAFGRAVPHDRAGLAGAVFSTQLLYGCPARRARTRSIRAARSCTGLTRRASR